MAWACRLSTFEDCFPREGGLKVIDFKTGGQLSSSEKVTKLMVNRLLLKEQSNRVINP